MAVLDEPLDFDSIDKKPVEVVCMVVSPEESPTVALKVMSQVAQLFSDIEAKKFFSGSQNQ